LRAAARASLGLPAVRRGSLEKAKLTASDGAAGDQFGASVAISNSTAVVGAWAKDSSTGAAYVFVRSETGTWSEQAKLTASDGVESGFFGQSVAVSGSTAVVGAFGRDAAYVFVRSGTIWSQQAELTASDGAPGDGFGISVALSGSRLVVGSDFNNGVTGAAYVFVRSATAWSEQAKLTASDGAGYDRFGGSVAISGSSVVVGAVGNDFYTGAAYVFERAGMTWPERAKLTASDGAGFERFGESVAITGSRVVVGASGHPDAGAAYVFVRSETGTWSEQAKLTASDGVVGDRFGSSVAIVGPTAVAGAPGRKTSTGAAYVFVRSGTTWPQQARLTASDGARRDGLGSSVAISGSRVIVGAPSVSRTPSTGAAYLYVLPQ
jgi:nucleoside-specific outer membrane channel protein Tsx